MGAVGLFSRCSIDELRRSSCTVLSEVTLQGNENSRSSTACRETVDLGPRGYPRAIGSLWCNWTGEGGYPRAGLSWRENHVFERFAWPPHFFSPNLTTQLQNLKKIQVSKDITILHLFRNICCISSLDIRSDLHDVTQVGSKD